MAAVAAVVATAFAVALGRRYVAGERRNRALLVWTVSLGMFAVASLTLAVGEAVGWSAAWFRTYYLFGGVLVVPWLALGSVITAGRDRVTTRVLGVTSLVVGALLAVPAVVADDPTRFVPGVVLSALLGVLLITARDADAVRAGAYALIGTFTGLAVLAVLAGPVVGDLDPSSLPEGSELFGPGVRGLAVGGNALGATVIVVGAVASSWRLRGAGVPHLVVGNLLIGLGVLIAASGGALAFLGDTESHAIAFAVGVTVMYAGFARTARPLVVRPGPGSEPAWR